MAQVTQITLIDDIDGGEADETLTFSLDGAEYEIDLSEVNADALREILAPYIKGGRKAGNKTATAGTRGRAVTSQRAPGEPSPEEYRTWAKANGLDVNERGRVPASVKEAYKAANA